MDWYLMALRRYSDFKGRSQRKEYWMFTLFNFLAMLVLRLLGGSDDGSIGDVLNGVYGLIVFLPSLAVGVRRFHDIGKSGWWILIALVPLIGGLVLLYFMVQDSQDGSNEYGPNPKAVPV